MDSVGQPIATTPTETSRFGRMAFGLGLVAVLAYFYSVHPVGFGSIGYAEDLCFGDLMRQLMDGILAKGQGPVFRTDQFMAPLGASVPFMSWGLERDWLGSYFWRLDPGFPFQWFYYGVSLVISYLGVGFLLGQMKVARAERWALAALFVVFNIPRHYKAWHHFEHLAQHWVYLGVFLDAWIWQRLARERRWSWNLEAWRGLLLLGMFGTAGYYWGPLILEWVIVRAAMGAVIWFRRRRNENTRVDRLTRAAGWPVVLGLGLLAIDLRWYLPLFEEARKWGEIRQNVGYYANFGYLIRPLWLEPFLNGRLPPIDKPETVVTVGWLYWVPLLVGARALRRKVQGAGLVQIAPFLILIALASLYMNFGDSPLHALVRGTVPFMKFFRVACRWGLLLPPILGATIALAWPEIRASVLALARSHQHGGPRWGRSALVAGAGLGVLELWTLSVPVNLMPPIPRPAQAMLERVGKQPGDTVLDLPFCVTGGNGGCAVEQCAFYPVAAVGACLRTIHGKKVYGLYQSRMDQAGCATFAREPYLEWFRAWKENRCFTGPEWDGFCSYLKEQPTLSAVLVYPEIWTAAAEPACNQEFLRRLGPPRGVAAVQLQATRGGEGKGRTRVMWYGTRCL